MDEFKRAHDNDREYVDLRVLEERLTNFIEETLKYNHEMREEIKTIRAQTHDWMQTILNRLPPWASAIAAFLVAACGAMISFILTHSWH
jgi:hypothetical protein